MVPEAPEQVENNKPIKQQNIQKFFQQTTSTTPKITNTTNTTKTRNNIKKNNKSQKQQIDQATITKRKGYWLQLAAKSKKQHENNMKISNTTKIQGDQKSNNLTSSHTEDIEYGNRPPELFFEASPKQRLKPEGVTSGKILESSLPNPGTNPGSIEK